MVASAPLLPKFVSEGAAMYHELRKRGTSVGSPRPRRRNVVVEPAGREADPRHGSQVPAGDLVGEADGIDQQQRDDHGAGDPVPYVLGGPHASERELPLVLHDAYPVQKCRGSTSGAAGGSVMERKGVGRSGFSPDMRGRKPGIEDVEHSRLQSSLK